jgi:hypothetical protein
MKRYEIIIQHEIIIYAEDEEAARGSLSHNSFLRDRTNMKCVSITEILMPEAERAVFFEDNRKAPGA